MKNDSIMTSVIKCDSSFYFPGDSWDLNRKLIINAKKIVLKDDEIELVFDTDKLNQYKSIIINGVEYYRNDSIEEACANNSCADSKENDTPCPTRTLEAVVRAESTNWIMAWRFVDRVSGKESFFGSYRKALDFAKKRDAFNNAPCDWYVEGVTRRVLVVEYIDERITMQ